MSDDVLRYAAFTDRPSGGNPAGVVLDAAGMTDDEMLAIAAELGYSETAFLTGGDGAEREIRYFSPLAEVPFCGHATVATAVALAYRDGPGDVVFQTRSGPVPVTSRRDDQGRITATLTSVPPHVDELADADLDEALAALGWAREELDPELPPRVGFAGAHHLVIGAATRERLADLDYDFDRLAALMAARDWTTVQLVWREDADPLPLAQPVPARRRRRGSRHRRRGGRVRRLSARARAGRAAGDDHDPAGRGPRAARAGCSWTSTKTGRRSTSRGAAQ